MDSLNHIMKYYDNPDYDLYSELVKRPEIDTSSLKAVVLDVFSDVKEQGDEALFTYTAKYDHVRLGSLSIDTVGLDSLANEIDQELKDSIDVAYQNIHKFHSQQVPITKRIETSQGVECWRESRPIQKVGLYVPGGTAPLFSTVLMLGVPAQIAGCGEVILCTPPNQDGSIHPAMAYAARKCGIDRVFTIGGIQAIAAMCIGTITIPSVYKIFGPGNQYVTAAKYEAQNRGVAIDIPAGPSEVLVYADHTASAEVVAADLLSQAEHGVDSQVVLVTTVSGFHKGVMAYLQEQASLLPRGRIALETLKNSFACYFDSVEEAFAFINEYAPEHLIVASDQAHLLLGMVQNAGSVFVGNSTPESAGDYASGTNHTLPTAGAAKAYSGVSLDSFIKKITFQEITPAGLKNLGPAIISMAQHEKLHGHAKSVELRLKRNES